MKQIIIYLLELGAVSGLLLFITFVSWTKLALGSVLTVAGAFLPQGTADALNGRGKLKLLGVEITLSGVLRIGVVIGGLALITGEAVNGFSKASEYKEKSNDSAEILKTLSDTRISDSMTVDEIDNKMDEMINSLRKMNNISKDERVESIIKKMENKKEEIAKTRSINEIKWDN